MRQGNTFAAGGRQDKEVLNRKCTLMTSLTTAADSRKSEVVTKSVYIIAYDSTNQNLLSKIKVFSSVRNDATESTDVGEVVSFSLCPETPGELTGHFTMSQSGYDEF